MFFFCKMGEVKQREGFVLKKNSPIFQFPICNTEVVLIITKAAMCVLKQPFSNQVYFIYDDHYWIQKPKAYSEPCQTSKMELFAKICNCAQLLIIFEKNSI